MVLNRTQERRSPRTLRTAGKGVSRYRRVVQNFATNLDNIYKINPTGSSSLPNSPNPGTSSAHNLSPSMSAPTSPGQRVPNPMAWTIPSGNLTFSAPTTPTPQNVHPQNPQIQVPGTHQMSPSAPRNSMNPHYPAPSQRMASPRSLSPA